MAQQPKPRKSTIEATKRMAMCIALLVRNEMENFHVANLSNAQMAELNPLIRNAIFTGVYAYMIAEDDEAASTYVATNERSVPDYWEPPQFTRSYLEWVTLLESQP
jgi:hypothetical protein